MAAEDDQKPSAPPSPSPDKPSAPVRPSLLNTLQYRSSEWGVVAKKHIARQWLIYILLSVIGTAVALGISFAVAYSLVVTDIHYKVPLRGGATGVIQLHVNLLSIDPVAGTVSMDWYPLPFSACAPGVTGSTYDIFFDPNLTEDKSGGDDGPPPSNAPASDPTFRFNTTIYCRTKISDSTSTFRTTSKLTSDDTSRGSLQAYPFDLYKSQNSLYVLDVETNRSVPAEIVQTWGVAVNFEVTIDQEAYNSAAGMYFTLNVSRSRAVRYFVIIIVIANWTVTVAFLWITIACIFWKEEVVKELFLIPVSTLFAFTAVRASMPGAPDGFGAVVDVAGVLPNLAIMTFCSCILLILVLYERIVNTHKEMKKTARTAQAKKMDKAGGDVIPRVVVEGDSTERITPVGGEADKTRPASIRSEAASQASLRRARVD